MGIEWLQRRLEGGTSLFGAADLLPEVGSGSRGGCACRRLKFSPLFAGGSGEKKSRSHRGLTVPSLCRYSTENQYRHANQNKNPPSAPPFPLSSPQNSQIRGKRKKTAARALTDIPPAHGPPSDPQPSPPRPRPGARRENLCNLCFASLSPFLRSTHRPTRS